MTGAYGHELARRLLTIAHEFKSNDPREIRHIAETDLQVLTFGRGARSADAAGLLAFGAANPDLGHGLAAWATRAAEAA